MQRGQFILLSVIGKGSAFRPDLWDSALRVEVRWESGARWFNESNAHPRGRACESWLELGAEKAHECY